MSGNRLWTKWFAATAIGLFVLVMFVVLRQVRTIYGDIESELTYIETAQTNVKSKMAEARRGDVAEPIERWFTNNEIYLMFTQAFGLEPIRVVSGGNTKRVSFGEHLSEGRVALVESQKALLEYERALVEENREAIRVDMERYAKRARMKIAAGKIALSIMETLANSPPESYSVVEIHDTGTTLRGVWNRMLWEMPIDDFEPYVALKARVGRHD